MYSNWLGFGAFQWRAEDYISFVCKFMLGMGLGFELPVVLLTLVKIGVLNYRRLRAMWRYMIVIVLVLGRVFDHPGSRHPGHDGRAAVSAVRNQRVDRVVLGMARPKTGGAKHAHRSLAGILRRQISVFPGQYRATNFISF